VYCKRDPALFTRLTYICHIIDGINLVRIKYATNLVHSVVAYSAVHLLAVQERLSFLRTSKLSVTLVMRIGQIFYVRLHMRFYILTV